VLIDLRRGRLDAFGDPAPPLWFGQMHEFDANVGAIDVPRLIGGFASQSFEVRVLQWREHP